ncbi:hypothetical protein ACTMTI_17355 [Nonomuraea sp. H19]|uniref:hypothetical protein n=1 Tax=Nonomuraea sp. H19 TaxID=3452206 RepID=UPI003F899BBA
MPTIVARHSGTSRTNQAAAKASTARTAEPASTPCRPALTASPTARGGVHQPHGGGIGRSAPAPRQSLSPQRIAAVAVGIADAEGLDAITMRRLATELYDGNARTIRTGSSRRDWSTFSTA